MTTPNLDSLIMAGLALEAEGDEEGAIAHFRQLVAQYPDDARVQFELGGALDMAGYEADAIPYYQRAIELGLGGDYRLRVAIQLGSSLRNVVRHQEAVDVLGKAVTEYPNHIALRAFYALALTSAGSAENAVIQLLDVILRNPTVLEAYHHSLRYYTDELRGVASDEG